MNIREAAISNASKMLNGKKTISTVQDPLRPLPEGKKKKVNSIRK